MSRRIHEPSHPVAPKLVLQGYQHLRPAGGRSRDGLINIWHIHEDDNRRSPVRRRRATRQAWPFCLDHDHLRTYGQQRMRYRAIGPRPTIDLYRFEGPHTEVNLRSRIATDETGNDDRRVFGKLPSVRGHGPSPCFQNRSCTPKRSRRSPEASGATYVSAGSLPSFQCSRPIRAPTTVPTSAPAGTVTRYNNPHKSSLQFETMMAPTPMPTTPPPRKPSAWGVCLMVLVSRIKASEGFQYGCIRLSWHRGRVRLCLAHWVAQVCNADAPDHGRVGNDGWRAGEAVEESSAGATKDRRDVD